MDGDIPLDISNRGLISNVKSINEPLKICH